MPLTGFEPAIPASQRPQNHALDRATIGIVFSINCIFFFVSSKALIISAIYGCLSVLITLIFYIQRKGVYENLNYVMNLPAHNF